MPTRCSWAATPLGIAYHDAEWGVPLHDDRRLFEFLILEGAQAGLSWELILQKRDSYRDAFDGFDAVKVAAYDDSKVAELLANPGIVRNRLKVASAIGNARAFLDAQRSLAVSTPTSGASWAAVRSGTLGSRWLRYPRRPPNRRP